MIIKAQRALNGSSILIYSKDRSVYQEFPTQGALSTAIGDKLKAYFEVTVDESGMLRIHREVPKQNW